MSTSSFFRYFVALTIFFGLATQSFGQQDKEKLEARKAAAVRKIQEAEKILSQTTQRKASSLGELRALNKQIEAREELISSINSEIEFLNTEISETEVVIDAMESDLKNLKKEYASMIYAAYKSRNAYDRLTFLFSSESFNQFIMRIKYLEQYSKARKNQVKLINEMRDRLISEKASLESNISDKRSLLDEQIQEAKKIESQKRKQASVLADLRQKEQELKDDIENYKKDIAKLEKLIADLIKAEMKSTAASKTKSTSINIKALSSSFEENRKKLPWPVMSGFISEKFGTNPHPVLKRVKVPNDGINIQTNQDEEVRAVFDGEVKRVAIIPGELKYSVIIQHGEYYTVYARLKEVRVKSGQEVKINDVIGVVNTNGSGDSEVHFQIWKNTEKLDPELWLTKR